MALSLYDLNNNKATRDVATTISDGLMSATDKQKLDGIHGADLVKKDGSVPMDNLTIGTRKSGSTVGTNSFVQGNNCEASGNYSHAEGINTTASGEYSHAEGFDSTASGNYSHAQNRYTIAQGYSQTAIGRYNVLQGTGTGVSATDDAFIIGNGTSTSLRSNAFKVSFDGKAWTQEGYYVGASNYAVYHTGNISNSALTLANASGIKGTGSGPTNLSYFQFFENDGTTRQGYIGYGDSSGTLFIWNELNTDIYIKTSGAGKAKINGNEILTANTTSMLGDGSYVLGRSSDDRSLLAFLTKTDYTTKGYIGYNSNLHMAIQNYRANGDIGLITAGTGKVTINGNEIYHAGNLKAKTDATLYNEILGTVAGTLITSGTHNQAIGHGSLSKNVGGSGNTAIGSYALFNNTGNNNFAIGQNALYENTTGTNNIGIGQGAVQANTTGSSNIGIGTASLWGLASGQNNIGLGTNAGRYYGTGTNILTTASQCVYIGNVSHASANNVQNEIVIGYGATGKGSNTAVIGSSSITNLYVGDATVQLVPTDTNSFYGNNAGRSNAGSNNTGIGEQTLFSLSLTGSGNTAVGKSALNSNSIASYNTGIGMRALDFTSSGSNNVAVGTWALQNNTTGTYNVGIGVGAGRYYGASTNTNTKANNCIYIGYDTRSNADNATNEIVIGNSAKGYGSNTAHIGNSSVTSISFGAGTGTAFTNRSDRRLKEDIIDADTSICYDTIKNLPLHRFKYKDFVGNEGDQHLTGFIADEFEQVFPKAVFKNDHSFPLLDEFGNPIMKAVSEEVIEIDEFGNEIKKTIEREVEDSFIIEDCASIDTSQIVPTLLGAVQKMMQEIEELKAEVAILKGIQ